MAWRTREQQYAYLKEWKTNNLEKVREYQRQYKKRHEEQIIAYWRRFNQERKSKILTHYGNGKLACVHCGEDRLAALSLDHINGGGNQHRKAINKAFYLWIVQQGFPEGYQTLCMNCQFVKRDKEREYVHRGH